MLYVSCSTVFVSIFIYKKSYMCIRHLNYLDINILLQMRKRSYPSANLHKRFRDKLLVHVWKQFARTTVSCFKNSFKMKA